MQTMLIIGNGFDLAHGLPTRYSDFLIFSEAFMDIPSFHESYDVAAFQNVILSKYSQFPNPLVDSITETFEKRRKNTATTNEGCFNVPILQKYYDDLHSNIWFEYFEKIYSTHLIVGQDWIDFEREVLNVIKFLDDNTYDYNKSFTDFLRQIGNKFDRKDDIYEFYNEMQNIVNRSTISVNITNFINKLYIDLKKLTEALEIYLSYFVDRIKIEQRDDINEIYPDYVLSFNYTDTFERVYGSKDNICYIHGKCREVIEPMGNFDGETSNLVLGIDEYLNKKQRDENNQYVIFKKFVQRIRNHNDTKYWEWAQSFDYMYNYVASNIMGEKNYLHQKVKICIYGHSLDRTDKDVLKLFLKPEWSIINLFVKDAAAEGTLIENLIKIVSEKNVIKKSSSCPPQLCLRRQYKSQTELMG